MTPAELSTAVFAARRDSCSRFRDDPAILTEGPMMQIVDRATEILMHPDNEWGAVAQESSSAQDLLLSYVAPLAAIPAVASFVGMTVVGFGGVHASAAAAFFHAIVGYAVDLLAVYALAHLTVFLAPRFGTRADLADSFRLAVYSFTPVWIAGVVGLIPALGLLVLAGYLYAGYLMIFGAERLLGAPKDGALRLCGISLASVFAGVAILHRLLAATGDVPRML
jgi:hypothetical protein